MEVETAILAIAAIATPVVVNVLMRIKAGTDANAERLGEVSVHLARINGAVDRNAERLTDHIDDDRRVEDRRDEESKRTLIVLDQIWAKIHQIWAKICVNGG